MRAYSVKYLTLWLSFSIPGGQYLSVYISISFCDIFYTSMQVHIVWSRSRVKPFVVKEYQSITGYLSRALRYTKRNQYIYRVFFNSCKNTRNMFQLRLILQIKIASETSPFGAKSLQSLSKNRLLVIYDKKCHFPIYRALKFELGQVV